MQMNGFEEGVTNENLSGPSISKYQSDTEMERCRTGTTFFVSACLIVI